MKTGIIMFDSEDELEQYVRGRLNLFLTSLYHVNFEIPEYGKFVPYNQREECHWLFCDACRNTFLGPLKEKEMLIWCPNCNVEDHDGEWTGEPGRLCDNCWNIKTMEAKRSIDKMKARGSSQSRIDMYCSYHPLPGGNHIDYFVPLEGEELEKWRNDYSNRTIPVGIEGKQW